MSLSRLALFAGPLLALSATMQLRFQFNWETSASHTLGVALQRVKDSTSTAP